MKTTNNERQHLGQALISEEVKYMQAVYVCCHFGHCQSKATGQWKCRRQVFNTKYFMMKKELEYRWYDFYIISYHVLWYVWQNRQLDITNVYINMLKDNCITPDKIYAVIRSVRDKTTQFKTLFFTYVLLINVWQIHIYEQIASCSSVTYTT